VIELSNFEEFDVNSLCKDEIEELYYDWSLWARKEQLAPKGDWITWLLMGGRGSGKTRAGAEWVRSLATGKKPVMQIALVGETIAQARSIMVEGESGILNICPNSERPKFDQVRNKLVWENGAEAILMSGSEPERFRGPQFGAAWCDEIGKWPNAEEAWDMLQFALRLGERPMQLATTTPRPTKLLKRLLGEKNTVITKMKTDENRANLATSFLEQIVDRYRGSVLGRQELDGELIEDLPDALWPRSMIESVRVIEKVEVGRIIVAVDPPISAHKKSDACGIIVAGLAGERAVVLADRSLKPAKPLAWAKRVCATYDSFGADAIIVEVNQGGDMVSEMIAQVDPNIPIKQVRATRSKWVRAEPVAALYARGLVLHKVGLNELEDEMCAFGANGLSDGHSPDRVDAMVWAISELLLNKNMPRMRRF
jgi:phage terminase large subunit-like protein